MGAQCITVGEGKSAVRFGEDTGNRLPSMASRVMQKLIAAEELQVQCESGRLYMSEDAQLAMWRETYEMYSSFVFSPDVMQQRQCPESDGYAIVTELGFLLSEWGIVQEQDWQALWNSATQKAQLYIMQHGGSYDTRGSH